MLNPIIKFFMEEIWRKFKLPEGVATNDVNIEPMVFI